MFEKVNPSHPDKVADRIAGAVVDLAYTKNRDPKVAVEVLLGHGKATVMIESSEDFRPVEIEPIVRRLAGDVELDLHAVRQDPHLANNQEGAVRCGDNGIFKGVPPTHEQKLLTAIAASIYDRWPYDGKYIIQDTIAKLTDKATGKPLPFASERNIKGFTICQSNASKEELFAFIEEIAKEKGGHFFGDDKNGAISADENKCCILIPDDKSEQMWGFYINPLGPWTGGIDVDCGCTNRKLGSDMGDGVTGGGLMGKDLSKADVSVNIVCYLKAVASGQVVTACCSIGDEDVTFTYADGRRETERFADIVEQARLYIHTIGGFEKFAEWGLVRPLAQV